MLPLRLVVWGDPEIGRSMELVSSSLMISPKGPERISLPEFAWNSERRQWRADLLLVFASSRVTEPRGRVLLIVEGDGYVPGFNFVFGLARRGWGGIVFTERLKGGLYWERLAKEIVHELGHSLGLGHCSNPRCVMFFSNSLADTDRKTMFFCRRCALLLSSKGYRVVRRVLEEAG